MDAVVNRSLTDYAGIPRVPDSEPDPQQLIATQRIKIFNKLNEEVPLNEFGLPVYIYRADLVPSNIASLTEKAREDALSTASVEVSYREGYPTFYDGRALWSQMEFEPIELFDAFQQYLSMGATMGARRLEMMKTEIPPYMLSEAFAYYYWNVRCRAYDLFKVAAYQKEREARIYATNDRHYLQAEKLLGQLDAYFSAKNEDGEPAWMDDMTPTTAIVALEKITKVQRLSLGLTGGGVGEGSGGAPASSSLELILRTIASQHGAGDGSVKGSVNAEMLMRNPETARLAQELIIKLGQASDG